MNTQELLSELEANVILLTKELQTKKKEVSTLQNERNELQDELNNTKATLKIVQDKYKEMKIISGLNGNPEHRRLMKLKLNRLVKEIDICIAEISNKSL